MLIRIYTCPFIHVTRYIIVIDILYTCMYTIYCSFSLLSPDSVILTLTITKNSLIIRESHNIGGRSNKVATRPFDYSRVFN